MKTLIVILLLFGSTTFSYSQKKEIKENMEITNLPEIVVRTAQKDFSVYIHDHNPDEDVSKVQKEFLAYDIGKDYMGVEEYLVIMKIKKGSLVATYNSNGILTRVVERYKNVKLPNSVVVSVYKAYPQWTILSDKLLYKQSKGKILNHQYDLEIKKGEEVKRLVVDPDGEIIKEI